MEVEGLKVFSNIDKYLGLPAIDGRSKTQALDDLWKGLVKNLGIENINFSLKLERRSSLRLSSKPYLPIA